MAAIKKRLSPEQAERRIKHAIRRKGPKACIMLGIPIVKHQGRWSKKTLELAGLKECTSYEIVESVEDSTGIILKGSKRIPKPKLAGHESQIEMPDSKTD